MNEKPDGGVITEPARPVVKKKGDYGAFSLKMGNIELNYRRWVEKV